MLSLPISLTHRNDMKIKPLALILSALFLALAPRAARADDEVSFQFFYDTLSPLGEWVQVGDYGDCWHPTGVDEDWAPYTDGYWSYTDAGWTWVSYEDWGGITYHYGRWVRTDEEGWCWVPDYEWGPAWVSWRNNEEAVGWAPLPPEAHWRASVGISTWCDDTYDIGPDYYTFCPIVEFGAPLIRTVCYPRSRNVFFIGNTFNCTNISFNSYHNVVFCGGPNFAFINGRSRHHVPSLKLVIGGGDFHRGGRGGRGWTNARNVGNTLQVYAPKIVNNNTTIINKPKITKVINKTQVNKGWNSVKDQGERQKVRAQIKEQNKGLTADTAPAKPVKAEDLKGVPEKADVNAPSPVAVNNRKGGKDRNGDGVPDNQKGNIGAGNVPKAGQDRNGDGVPDNQKGKVGEGNVPKVGRDQNGDGVPDNQPGKGPKVVGKDQNADGVPDGQQGQGAGGKVPKMVGKDQNGDGVPDNQPGKTGPGNGQKGVGRDQNGDGIPDNQKGNVVPGNGPKPGKDLNGDGIPDRRGSGGFVPPGKTGNGEVEQPGKRNEAQQQQQQEQAARRQEMAERQRARQAQLEAQQQQKQQNQAEQQERAIQNQRNQQVQRQQEMQRQRQELQRERQPDIQRERQPEVQRQPQVQRERPQQQQTVPRQAVPQRQPQPQPNNGGGQGKGKNQAADDEDGQKKKRN
jgi:hypothetical protein